MDDKTDYHWNILYESNSSYIFPKESSRAFPYSYSSTDNFVSSILASDWLIFCCKNLILNQKKKWKWQKHIAVGNMLQTLEMQRKYRW